MSKRLTIEEFIETLKQGGSGSGGNAGSLIVTFTRSNGALVGDKTYGEIWDAASSGSAVVLIYSDTYGDHIVRADILRYDQNGEYQFSLTGCDIAGILLTGCSADKYPTEDKT